MAFSTRLFLGLCCGSLSLHLTVSQSASYNCTYSTPLELSDDVTLEHYVNSYDNTITMRMTYEDGYAWLGLGINLEGAPTMVPALAVIGDWDRRIQRYSLQSSQKDGEGVLALGDERRHLKNGFFLQENDRSVLVFSQDLVMFQEEVVLPAPGPVPGAPQNQNTTNAPTIAHEITVNSTWIWAVGRDDNRWDGRHKLYGSFTLDLHDGCEKVGGSNTDVATSVPAPVPIPAPVPSPTQASRPQNIPMLPEGDIMGDNVPIPIYNDGENDNENSSVFDEIAGAEEFETEQQAHLFYASTRLYWIFHGVLMGFAWGVLAPLAVGAAVWRNRLAAMDSKFSERTMLWTRLQYCLSLSVVVLTVLGFLLAILAKRQGATYANENESPSSPTENVHAIMGMAILALLLVQGIIEYMRRCFTDPSSSRMSRASLSIHSAHQNPSAHMMMINGFALYDRRQALSPQEREMPTPYGNGRPDANDEVNYPSDMSLLTSSVYSGHFAILNLSSVLGEGSDVDMDIDNNQILGGLEITPSPRKGGSSLPNASLEDDDGHKMIFADDEDQSWQVTASDSATSRRQAADAVNDAANEKDVTPATSPDTSREEVETPSSATRRFRPSCCLTAQKLESCWSCMLLCTMIVIMALGWYNCHTGIVLQAYLADMEDFESILVALFWGFAVGIVVLVSVVLCLAHQSSAVEKP